MIPQEIEKLFYEYGLKHLFPLAPKAKIPAIKNWIQYAENCKIEKIVNAVFSAGGGNVGVYCKDIFVIDLDVREDRGVDGVALFKAFLAKEGKRLPKTLTVRTPSGGVHLYWRQPKDEPLRSKIGLREFGGKGVDLKGEGGYVVAPFAETDAGVYEILDDSPVAEPPGWLLKALRGSGSASAPVSVPDSPEPVPEGERNVSLFRKGLALRMKGFSERATWGALVLENQTHVEPPLDEKEVRRIYRQVLKYTPKTSAALLDFPATAKESLEVGTFAQTLTDFQEAPEGRVWVLPRYYCEGYFSILISPGGVGKSTLQTLHAVALASGRQIAGLEPPGPTPVLLYNLEDRMDEVRLKVLATARFYEVPLDQLQNLHLASGWDKPFILAAQDRDGVVLNEAFLKTLRAYIERHKIRLLLIDPFALAHRVSENDNNAMGQVVQALARVMKGLPLAIGLAAHSRKAFAGMQIVGAQDSLRGASSLVSAARMAWTLSYPTQQDRDKFHLSDTEAAWLLRLDSAKSSLLPPAASATWLRRETVEVEVQGGRKERVGVLRPIPYEDLARQANAAQNDPAALLRAELSEILEGMVRRGQETITFPNLELAILTGGGPASQVFHEKITSTRRRRELVLRLWPNLRIETGGKHYSGVLKRVKERSPISLGYKELGPEKMDVFSGGDVSPYDEER